MAVIDLKNTTITLQDGTGGTPNSVTARVGSGQLKYTETQTREYIKDRGLLYQVRNGDEEPVDVSLEFLWEFLLSDTGNPPSIEDALYKRGEAASWVTTDTDPCAPYCLDWVIVNAPPCAGVKTEHITLGQFRYEKLDHDAKAGQVSVSGKCNLTKATITRV